MRIIAFDPGRSASFAVMDSHDPHVLILGNLETIGTGRLVRPCPLHIGEIARGVDAAVVEEVGARPMQGVSSVFTFGLALGAILGALSAYSVPVVMVRPQDWKKSCRLSGMNGKEAKIAALAAAKELWPGHAEIWRVQANHGMADAALMARWYFEVGPGRDVPRGQAPEKKTAPEP